MFCEFLTHSSVDLNAKMKSEEYPNTSLSCLTLSVQVVLLNSPNLSPYFSFNKFEKILLLIYSSLLCLINSQFLIAKCLSLYVLCKEKSGVDN